jgi:pyridoxamine 5'-phosphate oxidase
MNLQTAPKNNPFPLFEHWLNEAKSIDPVFYCGMTIATVNAQGLPSNRVVLLKEFDEKGFVFYTNYHSRKGQELTQNPNICANFWWKEFQRQIRIDGQVEKVSSEQSDRYFLSRPQGSQLAAIASQQSQPIESFEVLQQRYQQTVAEYKDKPITRPEHWGGYRIIPTSIEFWQGLDHRLHHRLRYSKSNGEWITECLQP